MARQNLFVLLGSLAIINLVSSQDYSLKSFQNLLNLHPLQQPQSPALNQLPTWARNRTNQVISSQSRATTLHGVPVPSLTASQAIGTRDHLLFQDFILMDKLGAFARERIPERVVHAKGAGAHGFFEVTHDVSQFTKAKFLNGIGKKTPIFARLSTVIGERGTADTLVDLTGFAIKLYTEDGIHDIVGNNLELFAIRDPLQFPDIIRSRKRNPQTNLYDQNAWWDFVALRPETTLHTLQLFSDLGRPDGFRRADGSAVHAFKLVNSTGSAVFAKFVWKSKQRAPALTHLQAKELAGLNPEYKTQDLFDAIERKEYPSWDLFLQVMRIPELRNYRRNPFDITATWREEEIPHIPVGTFTLNRNPVNYFAEVEQVGFQVSNMVPGIEPSPDRMLAARLFSYQDAQRYRLTTNGAQIPINRPITPVTSYNRDGLACHGDNGGSSPNYFPNSFGGTQPDVEWAKQGSFRVEGIVDRYDLPEDEFTDARMFLEKDVDPAQRKRLVAALADRLKDASPHIWERVLKNNFYPVEEAFGDEVRAAILDALQVEELRHEEEIELRRIQLLK